MYGSTQASAQQNTQVPTDPVSYLGYQIGLNLGTNQPNSPVTQGLKGVADISQKLQDGIFWLNVGGIIIGTLFILIAVKALVK